MTDNTRFTPKQKAAAVVRVIKGEITAVALSKELGVGENTIGRWKKKLLDNAEMVFLKPEKPKHQKVRRLDDRKRQNTKMIIKSLVKDKIDLQNVNYMFLRLKGKSYEETTLKDLLRYYLTRINKLNLKSKTIVSEVRKIIKNSDEYIEVEDKTIRARIKELLEI